MYLVERWVNNVTFQLEKRGGRERRERGNRFHNFHRPIFIYIIVLTRESKNSPSYTSTGNRSSPSVFFSFLSLSLSLETVPIDVPRRIERDLLSVIGGRRIPPAWRTRVIALVSFEETSRSRRLSGFTWSRLEIGTVTHRWFYLYAIVSALSVSERANLSSPVTSRDRVTPPSRRPTTTELSRVWYGELLLRIYCAIVPSSFFLFSSLPPPFLFRFRFSIQLIAKF